MYIYARGAENTKVSTNNKCKVQNFNNNLQDSVNQEYQQRNLSNISTQNLQIFYIYKGNMQNFKFLMSQTLKHMIFLTTIDNKEIMQSEQIAQQ